MSAGPESPSSEARSAYSRPGSTQASPSEEPIPPLWSPPPGNAPTCPSSCCRRPCRGGWKGLCYIRSPACLSTSARRPAVLHPAASLATSGRRPCYIWPSALLLPVAGLPANDQSDVLSSNDDGSAEVLLKAGGGAATRVLDTGEVSRRS
jgi:hypothetical protein